MIKKNTVTIAANLLFLIKSTLIAFIYLIT
jgi:hypothetical protein